MKLRRFIKKAVCMALLAATMITAVAPAVQVNAASKKAYRTAYKKIVSKKTAPTQYRPYKYSSDCNSKSKYTSYFTYDLDKNGTPELFLKTNGGQWIVLTYHNKKIKKVTAFSNDGKVYINKSKKLVFTCYSYDDDEEVYRYYDFKRINAKNKGKFDSACIFSDLLYCEEPSFTYETNRWDKTISTKKSDYDSYYASFVKGATKITSFKATKIGSTKGIK